MSLIVCPDCRGKVSSYAPACPHCGCPAPIRWDSVASSTQSGRVAAGGPVSFGDQFIRGILTILVLLVGVAFVSAVVSNDGRFDTNTPRFAVENLKRGVDTIREGLPAGAGAVREAAESAKSAGSVVTQRVDALTEQVAPAARKLYEVLSPQEQIALWVGTGVMVLLLLTAAFRAASTTPAVAKR
ncbi:MAG: hypothetical protein HYZ53_20770 [Planctomycetes bacterium]|nr:hypothetical protein [Planctomycetota bacterium]